MTLGLVASGLVASLETSVGPSAAFNHPMQTLIERRTMTDELVGHLREKIRNGQLRAGSRISVRALCIRFGVSRTPLREALRVLANEGLVILSPNKSAIVARPSPEQIAELIPILGALEVLAVELACERIDDDGLKRLRLLHQRCVESYEERDSPSFQHADIAIRDLIFDVAANPRLKDLYRILHALLRTPVAVAMPPEWNAAVREQSQILLALEMKNADMGGLVTRRYLRHRFANLRAPAQDKPARRMRRTAVIGGNRKASAGQQDHPAEL